MKIILRSALICACLVLIASCQRRRRSHRRRRRVKEPAPGFRYEQRVRFLDHCAQGYGEGRRGTERRDRGV